MILYTIIEISRLYVKISSIQMRNYPITCCVFLRNFAGIS